MADTYYARERDNMLHRNRRATPRQQTLWTNADLEPVFADQVQLTRVGSQYYLTFGQLRVPVNVGEDHAAEVREIRPVAQIVFPTDALDQLQKALRNIE